jgi:hypothetical protein
MINAVNAPLTTVRCRRIAAPDLDAVADLLARGFPTRGRAFWVRALELLRAHPTPPGLPEYGYLLESGGAPVGAILLIFSAPPNGVEGTIRGNVSSWYVEPAFRGYAALLVAQALKQTGVTYVNVTPIKHTWPILAAQGYARYCNGTFLAVPALKFSSGGARVEPVDAEADPGAPFAPFERTLLLDHAGYGCIGCWAVTPARAHPFVFRPFAVKGIEVAAQLIYCRSVDDFVRFAGPLGRFLLARGKPLVVLDADGPVAGLAGKFLAGKRPRFFKGPERPRCGDLAYTEIAMFGV